MRHLRVPLPLFLIAAFLAIYFYLQVPVQTQRQGAGTESSVPGAATDGASPPSLRFGSGGVTGVFYPTAGAIAEIVNEKQEEHGVLLVPQSTGGSVYNLRAVMAGELDIAITQASVQYAAMNGTGPWEEAGAQANLRTLCSLFSETLMLLAADDSGIEALPDLAGKRVGVGNLGSGTAENVAELLRTAGGSWAAAVTKLNLTADDAARQLETGKIDAFFFSAGHPAPIMERATLGQRPCHFVPITGVEEFLRRRPYYRSAFIPHALYPNARNRDDIPTIGDPAVLIASARLSNEEAYAITRSLVGYLSTAENQALLRRRCPALWNLKPDDMTKYHFAPTHAGARRYFVEAGFLTSVGARDDALRRPRSFLSTGPSGSLLNPLGGDLVRAINSTTGEHGIAISLLTSTGPRQNIQRVVGGTCQLGLAGAADLYLAYHGIGSWAGQPPQRTLRAVSTLFREVAILAVRPGRGIAGVQDLAGKRIGADELDVCTTPCLKDLLRAYLGEGAQRCRVLFDRRDAVRALYEAGELDAVLFSCPRHLLAGAAGPFLDTVRSYVGSQSPFALVSLPHIDPRNMPFLQAETLAVPTQEEPIETISVPVVLFCSEALANSDTMIRALGEALPAVAKTQERFAGREAADLLNDAALPYHAQVLAYAEAHGLSVTTRPVGAERLALIGAGPSSRGPFAVAGALARTVSESRRRTDVLTLGAEPTAGALENLRNVLRQRQAFALVPATNLWEAYTGEGHDWQGRPQEELRTVCSVYVAPLTVLAAVGEEESVDSLRGLEGRRVSLPVPPQTGFRDNAISLFSMSRFQEDLHRGRFIVNPEEPPISAAVEMFLTGTIQAFFCTVQHPSNTIMHALSGTRRGQLLPITGLYSLISKYPYYTVTTISADHYPNLVNPRDVGTIGVPITLVTSVKTDAALVRKVIQSLDEEQDYLHRLNRAVPQLTAARMLEGLVTPLHPAAKRYFEEREYLAQEDGAERQVLVLGTGKPGGVFYPVGCEIERLINRRHLAHEFRLVVDSTEGSIRNATDVAYGGLQLGLVETNTLNAAITGTGSYFRDLGPQEVLRSICTLHRGYLMLIAAEESGIRAFRDLAGKRVNIGNPGSGTRGNVDDLYALAGTAWMDSIQTTDWSINKAVSAFRKGQIDAFFFNVGLSSEEIYRAVDGTRPARFVAIPAAEVEGLYDKWPGYVAGHLPVHLFPKVTNTEETVETITTPTVLVTSSAIKSAWIEAITREIFENLDTLRSAHKALGDLQRTTMVRNTVAPLHAGARKYYDEVGLPYDESSKP